MGSTSYITSRNGSISQHVEYIAFGEVLFEEHSSSFSSPYLFNGKEYRETNLSYYGARYLDMKTSLWLSVDPMTEKMPNCGAYIYALNNPIKYVDPDGEYPKPSEILRSIGLDLNPFMSGYIDGLVDASPVGAVGFAWDFSTDSTFRDQTIEGIKELILNPVESLEKIVGEKAENYTAVFNGTATDEQMYSVGEDAGNLTGAILTGAGIKKIFDKLKKGNVEFTADLKKTTAKSRSGHTNAGNKQLNDAMTKNPKLRKKMEKKLGSDVYDRTSTSGKGRRNPKDYEWDHNSHDKNKLDLRSKKNHAKKTSKDPGRVGGYSKYWKNQ